MDLLSINASDIVMRTRVVESTASQRRVLSGIFDDVDSLGTSLSGSLNTTECFAGLAADSSVVVVELELKGSAKAEYDALVAATQDGSLDLTPDSSDPLVGSYMECASAALLSVGGGVPPSPLAQTDDDGISMEDVLRTVAMVMLPIAGVVLIITAVWYLNFSKQMTAEALEGKKGLITESAGRAIEKAPVYYTPGNRRKTRPEEAVVGWKINL